MGRLASAVPALIVLALLSGCGDRSESTQGARAKGEEIAGVAPDATRVPPLRDRTIGVGHLRRAVLRGVGRDYLGGTQVGPPSFGLCLQRGSRRRLDEASLRRLALVYRRPGGQQFTAQALNALAEPVGVRCGGRRFVPMLIEASMAFRAGRLRPAANRELRLAYGPYLGVTCRPAGSAHCDSVGIDLVLRRKAAAVSAWVGGRRLRLRTPGLHTGAGGRDWVGYLDRVGFERPGSPFRLPSNGGNRGAWAGSPAVYLTVRLEVAYSSGGRASDSLPRVFLSPGWG
jgi:hypothetical protein